MSEAPEVATVAEEEAALEERLGHRFARRAVLRRALRHRSSEPRVGEQNERLEFLGDAVVQLAVSDLLFRRWPDADEGALSRRRAALVNARVLAEKARALGVGRALRLGRGEEKTGGREKDSILAGAFEALLGAVFLDGGFAAAHGVGRRLFERDVEEPIAGEQGDFKTRLQELAQERLRAAPVYELVCASGPDHAKEFEVRVSLAGEPLGVGTGPSKKRAEQAAARVALERLSAKAPAAARPER